MERIATTKVIRQGERRLVELPAEFRLAGDEVEFHRLGDELVLRDPIEKTYGEQLIEILEQLSDLEIPDDPPPQERSGI